MDLVDLHMLTNILSTHPSHNHQPTPSVVCALRRLRENGQSHREVKNGSQKHTNPQLLQM